MNIPKIIHHTAPTDSSKWHPLWHKCFESWKSVFTDFEFKFWNDEDLDNLVKTHYKEYWDTYQKFPVHIMKIDFARYCIMHRFGGIYADMDMFCYQNFYKELTHTVSLIESSLFPDSEEKVQNSLMCAEPNSEFFKAVLDRSAAEFNLLGDQATYQNHNLRDANLTLKITGPVLLTNVVSSWKKFEIGILSAETYNNIVGSYHTNYRTKHGNTLYWGKEIINSGIFKQEDCFHMIDGWILITGRSFDSVTGLNNALKQFFPSYECVPMSSFDFYCDYAKSNRLESNRKIEDYYELKEKFEIFLLNFGIKLISKEVKGN